MQDFRRGRHSVSLLTVHLVYVTKYRLRGDDYDDRMTTTTMTGLMAR